MQLVWLLSLFLPTLDLLLFGLTHKSISSLFPLPFLVRPQPTTDLLSDARNLNLCGKPENENSGNLGKKDFLRTRFFLYSFLYSLQKHSHTCKLSKFFFPLPIYLVYALSSSSSSLSFWHHFSNERRKKFIIVLRDTHLASPKKGERKETNFLLFFPWRHMPKHGEGTH